MSNGSVKCKRCNHWLYKAESIEAGIGPICAIKTIYDKVVKQLCYIPRGHAKPKKGNKIRFLKFVY